MSAPRRHRDNGVTCCRARRETAAEYYAGHCPRWLWVRLPFWAHPLAGRRSAPNTAGRR